MKVTRDNLKSTRVKLTFVAEPSDIESAKKAAVKRLGANIKLDGFRAGRAPKALIEKNIDQQLLQTEVLENAINNMYVNYAQKNVLRPVSQPEVSVTKYVPFTDLEFVAELDVVGKIDLGNYKKIKLVKPTFSVTASDVDAVLNDLKQRSAQREDVTRAAKNGDELTIDFLGIDTKTKEPINGADGKAYPIILGSNTFIPGFEPNLVGLKPGQEKTFDIVFPAEYNVAALQKRKVTFTVTVHKIQAIKPLKLDDNFASTVSPFKTLAELKTDIKKQLEVEKAGQAQRALENELLEKISAGAKVDIPESLLEGEINRMEDDEKRNIAYRGQTWQEHLQEEGLDEQQHRDKQRPNAELRVKIGLVLGAVAEEHAISVTPEEVELRVQLLKGQYTDPAMQAELDKPEGRRDIMSRLVSEKTVDMLVAQASK